MQNNNAILAANEPPLPAQRTSSRPHSSGLRALADAARDATSAFLGHVEVCGVGITYGVDPQVIFFLRRDSMEARRLLAGWAKEYNIPIDIEVMPAS